jgi:hypothetical protein
MTMTDVDALLREYIERYESEESADPREYLSQVEGPDRHRLSALIEGYLIHAAPPRKWDPDAFEGSVSERVVARLAESWSAASGHLPVELVDLRKEKAIKRSEVVDRLAEVLGVSAKREKVAFYYHRLEHGLLPARGVSSRVFDALAGILGTSAERLRSAGEAVGLDRRHDLRIDPLMARTAEPPPEEFAAQDRAAEQAPPEEHDVKPDEVDRLFTGGD